MSVFLQGVSKSDVCSGFCKNLLSGHLARIALIVQYEGFEMIVGGGFTFQFLQRLFLYCRQTDAERGVDGTYAIGRGMVRMTMLMEEIELGTWSSRA